MIFRWPERAFHSYSDLQFLVELRGFEPLIPSMRTKGSAVHTDGGLYRLVSEGDSRFRAVRAERTPNLRALPVAEVAMARCRGVAALVAARWCAAIRRRF